MSPSARIHPLAARAFVLVALTAPACLHAQPGPGPAPTAPPPEVRAARLETAIRVDGVLDEAAWQQAQPVTRFTQIDPEEGAPVSERTEVRVLIGEDALYVGARLFDRDARKIVARLSRRDDPVETDEFDVYLDTYHDHLTAKRFRVNPAGVILDGVIGADGNEDDSWDPVWQAAARVDAQGWTAELRIPLNQLRFAAQSDAVWGIQFERVIFRKGESASFAFTPKREQGGVSRYGNLVGLGELGGSHRLELVPYTSARNERLQFPAGDPFRGPSDYFGAAGADVKYGLTSDLTLDVTANPDFGQVEVDPAQVNLTAVETFYPEHRPFFIEGSDLFAFGGSRAFNNFGVPTIFHSRRIGRAPQLGLEDGEHADVNAPAQTTILGAAKLTGRTPGGWAVGALDAVTQRETADYVDTAGVERRAPVEPLTHYFAGRVRRELRQGNTAIGGLLTSVNRRLDDPALAGILRSDAVVGGIDLAQAWGRRVWAFDAALTGSRIQGSPEAIAIAQRASDRYLQRPDHGSYFTYDPGRTSLEGYGLDASLAKTAGEHWLSSLAYVSRSPGYEANDLGYESRADYRGLSSIVLFQQNRPGRLLRNWTVFPYFNEMWNFGGDRLYDSYAVSTSGTFTNFWSTNSRAILNRRVVDGRLTRGGVQATSPENGLWRASVTSDSRRAATVTLGFQRSWDEAGGYGEAPSLSISFRPSPAVRVRLDPSWTASRDMAQYVQAVRDPAATSTYGVREVFATLDQRVAELDTRVDWTLTPHLSLQLYLQPLVVSGRYTQFKELRRPTSYEFDVYGKHVGTINRDPLGFYVVDPGDGATFRIADPDFNYRSLLGNAVLRWEYRPGSTLYVVWQQQRTDVAPIGTFDFQRDYRALLDHAPQSVFAVKLTYWIGL